MRVIKFFHHLFNPHCHECEHDRACRNCETLQQLLTEERYEKKRLLDTILRLSSPVQVKEQEIEQPSLEEIRPKHVSWNVRRAMLEEQSRHDAQLKAGLKKSITDLEKELELDDAKNSGT